MASQLALELEKRMEDNKQKAQQAQSEQAKKELANFGRKSSDGKAQITERTVTKLPQEKVQQISKDYSERVKKLGKLAKASYKRIGKSIGTAGIFNIGKSKGRGRFNYKERIKILSYQNRLEKEKLKNQIDRYKLMNRVALLRKQGKLPIPKPANLVQLPVWWNHPEPIANADINSAFNADIGHADKQLWNEDFFLSGDYFGGEDYWTEDIYKGMIPKPRAGVSPLLWSGE